MPFIFFSAHLQIATVFLVLLEMRAILLLSLLACVAAACQTDFDCAQCHSCRGGVCTAVADYTDPNDECPDRCGVKTVCGPLHICVFQKRPTCNCDWMEGACIEEPAPVVVVPTIDELQARGLSDTDIVELLHQFKVEHSRYHSEEHKGHYHLLPEDSAAAHDALLLHGVLLVVLLATLMMGFGMCLWRRLFDQEILRANKAQ